MYRIYVYVGSYVCTYTYEFIKGLIGKVSSTYSGKLYALPIFCYKHTMYVSKTEMLISLHIITETNKVHEQTANYII